LATTTNIGLLYPDVRNNIGGDIPIDVPQPKYWRGCVPGIPGRVDASETSRNSSGTLRRHWYSLRTESTSGVYKRCRLL